MLSRLGASIMAESALVDKETARIYWEGGSTNTLSSSVNPYISIGVRHVKATILSCFLLMAFLSFVSNHRILHDQLPLLVAKAASSKQFTSWSATVLLFVLEWTILKIPKFDKWFVMTILVLYLVESYTCSTHQYLSHAISSSLSGPSTTSTNNPNNSGGVEDFIESLRNQSPIVTWKVRSFHYERRKLVALFPALKQIVQRIVRKSHLPDDDLGPITPSFLFTKKVVTHKHEGVYQYKNCRDSTTAGVWKRAPSTAKTSGSSGNGAITTMAPFTKIVLSKLLVLENAKTRQDYFQQQTNFVTQHGQQDEYAEFSTDIHIEGFKRRMLAVRDTSFTSSGVASKLFRKHMFWVFTFVGLTVPYRSWFAKHCDELRVTVLKETSCDKPKKKSYYSGWFSRSTTTEKEAQNANGETFKETFRKRMQELALYRTAHKDDSRITEEAENKALMMINNMEAARLANNLIQDSKDDQKSNVTTYVANENKDNTTNSTGGDETEIVPFNDADVDDGENDVDNTDQGSIVDKNDPPKPIVEDTVDNKNTLSPTNNADTDNLP
eukprot:CAMPEP_0195284334 /NCGR_PEP_ID=MMETSP0707-20130614/2569_1 /TAXON_ID=33640 /ORGANISM="Asterionellopsis glacialis, Strain CCMP134" /LENGTH=552 /DNA_ID=CAMNT_0040343661 /DNA_START=219 /DNA_END=1874 /DNA_ORIENTATION=+